MERDRADPSAVAERGPRERQRAIELVELVVDGDAQRLEGALGGMAGREAGGRRNRGADRIHQLERRPDRCPVASADDRPRDRAGMALLTEVAQRLRQAALVPLGDHLARAQGLGGIHAHIQRRVVGVGETACACVDLH